MQTLAKSTLVLAGFQATFEWFSSIVEKGQEIKKLSEQLEQGGSGALLDRKTTSREDVTALKEQAKSEIAELEAEYDKVLENAKKWAQIPVVNAVVLTNAAGQMEVIKGKIMDLQTILSAPLGEFKTAAEIEAAANNAAGAIDKMAVSAEALKEKAAEIGATFQDDVTGAIMSAVRGSATLGEAFGNVLNKLADQAMEVALNMMLWGSLGGGGTGGLFGGFFKSIFGSAQGGTVGAGDARIVGERGPELFVPHSSGKVIPNNRMGGNTNITVNVDASGSSVEGDAAESNELGKMLAVAIQQQLIKEQRPGGLLA